MSARLVVVRPEPGNARTVAAARAAGWSVDAMPLFAVTPLAWTPPNARAFDALLLTSANAARHGGVGLRALAGLPVLAVGEASAAAARLAGLDVALVGDGDGGDLISLARRHGYRRLLHLAGRERRPLAVDRAIAVYASDPLSQPEAAARLRGTVALHSARAAARVRDLVDNQAATAIVAISPAVLAAAGPGWRAAVAASVPTDAALLAAARIVGE